MAKQEEVLQKVTDYCNEKSYTLDDSFRTKFSEKFATANVDADVNDENVLNAIKFNIDTAFSAASKEIKIKDETWKSKESEYLKQIEMLKKNQKADDNKPSKTDDKLELPDDVKEKLEELNKFKEGMQKQEKRANVLKIAQKKVREDLHPNLEEVLNIMQLDYSKEDNELAEQLNANFTTLYKDKICDTRPASSNSNRVKDEDYISGVKKVEIKN